MREVGSRRCELGQVAVEAAIVLPLQLFVFLALLQLVLNYQARFATEHAAFKAARSASVYRVDCDRMVSAALMALLPTMPHQGGGEGTLGERYQKVANQVLVTRRNRPPFSTTAADIPLVLVDYRITGGRTHFDEAVEPWEDPMRVHVRVIHFHEYRIPFANAILARVWLAQQQASALASWAPGRDNSYLLVARARPDAKTGSASASVVEIAQRALAAGYYTAPLVSSWTMRMMSDPLPGSPAQRRCE